MTNSFFSVGAGLSCILHALIKPVLTLKGLFALSMETDPSCATGEKKIFLAYEADLLVLALSGVWEELLAFSSLISPRALHK